MQPNRELNDLEQLPEQLLRGAHEVECQVGQAVEQVSILWSRTSGLGGVGRVRLRQVGESGLPLGFQSVVALAQALGERVVGTGGLGLAKDVRLPLRE